MAGEGLGAEGTRSCIENPELCSKSGLLQGAFAEVTEKRGGFAEIAM